MATPILILGNMLSAGETLGAGGLTASSTKSGYNKDNVRDPNLFNGWRPNDSAVDEYLQFELSAALSTSFKTYYGFAIDSRNQASTDRSQLKIDGSTGGAYTNIVTANFTPGVTNGFISAGVGSFTAASAYTLIRFTLNYNGTTQVSPVVLHVCLASQGYGMDGSSMSDFQEGPRDASMVFNVPTVRTAARGYLTNRIAMSQQRLEMVCRPLTASRWNNVMNLCSGFGGSTRCLFAKLTNVALFNSMVSSGDAVVRIDSDRIAGDHFYRDNIDVTIPLISEPYSLR